MAYSAHLLAAVMTGELDESGLLEAATGETHELIGLDSGLYPLLKETVIDPSATAGASLQARAECLGLDSSGRC